jgi:hypothetical protein
MKKIYLVFGLLLLMSLNTQGQVSVNVNFGLPPVWAPANRVEAQYYYLPDIDAYYDVPTERFIYMQNGNWFRSASLPYRYRNYNLRGGNVVYLTDYRGNSPYINHKNHKIKYAKSAKYATPVNRNNRGEKNQFKGYDRKGNSDGNNNKNRNANGNRNGKEKKNK